MTLDQTDIGQLIGVDVNERLLVGGGHKGFTGTSRHLGGYAVLLGFLLRIGQTHRAVKGLAQRLAVNVAPECQLVLVAVVLAGWLFSWKKNNPFLTVKNGKIEVLMDVEVYQYLMSRSGVGSTGAGFFMRLTGSNSTPLVTSRQYQRFARPVLRRRYRALLSERPA